jgi:N-acetylglutamate synthase-like GNAT family acetyltransferase
MENRESPKVTGVSDITGKTVRVRHATEADMGFIEDKMKKYRLDTQGLDYGEFAVATENSKIIGFGRLKKTEAIYEIGCILVIEEKKRKGVGQLILEHLMEYAPVDEVYVMTDWVDFFNELGFKEMKKTREYTDIVKVLCGAGGQGKRTLMSYDKSCK